MAGGVLSIGELARRAGVSESTLRAWERRYGFLEPERTDGGHRRYRFEDLAVVEELLELVEDGLSVGSAARRLREQGPSPERLARVVAAGEPRPAAEQGDVDAVALTLAHRAALRLLHLHHAEDAPAVLLELVTELGGTVVPAEDADDDALPVDLSLGYGRPVLPSAPGLSLARMRLEFVLPQLVEGARNVVDLLRRAERG